MEQEMNDNQNQQGSWPKPPEEEKSFFQQESLQKTWLNVKLATWIKCLIISIVLSVAAVFIAPEFSPAHTQTSQSQQQGDYDYYCEYEDDWYDDSGDSWYDEYENEGDWYYDEYESDEYDYDSEDSWYDDYDDYDEYESEDSWYDDYEYEDDWSDYESQEDTSYYDYYYGD